MGDGWEKVQDVNVAVAFSEPLREIRCLGSSCLSEGGIAYNIDSEGIYLPFSSNFERAEACMNSLRALRNIEVILRSLNRGIKHVGSCRCTERAGILKFRRQGSPAGHMTPKADPCLSTPASGLWTSEATLPQV